MKIVLNGREEKIIVRNYYAIIKNGSGDEVHVSKNEDIASSSEGVTTIPDGGTACFSVPYNGLFYLLGNGEVEILGTDHAVADGGTYLPLYGTAADADRLGGLLPSVYLDHVNLLCNPDFAVNQRGATEYTSGYSVDRWSVGTGLMVTVGEHLKISRTAIGGYPQFFQNTEYIPQAGQMLTLSCRYKTVSGVFRLSLRFFGESGHLLGVRTETFDTDGEWHTTSITGTTPEGCTGVTVSIHDLGGDVATLDDAVELQYIKLETDGVATAFVSPDPTLEMLKCQRFYQVHTAGDIAAVDLRPQMRDEPTVTLRADGYYAYSADL